MNKKRVLLIVCMATAWLSAGAVTVAEKNELQKVFHHNLSPMAQEKSTDLILAKTVFYFKQTPVIKKMSETDYFLPNTIIDPATQKIVNEFNAGPRNDLFWVTVTPTQDPGPGLRIKIGHDPKKIMVLTDFLDAIGGAKALEIRFYNNTLLNTLKKTGKPLLQTAQIKKPMVVIDCGHGGNDFGTVGCFNTCEKEITLAVGLELAQELKANNIAYILTRADDRFVALDQRTLIANRYPQTILISLHANNAAHATATGLETFCLTPQLFKRERNPLATAIDVMIDSYDEQLCQQSKLLAQATHDHILKNVRACGYNLADRKVKFAASQVLLGVKGPSILIEIGFLSNEHEALCLKNKKIQQSISAGICQGIMEFSKVS